MRCTASELRKSLFTALGRAAKGEVLEVIYKGSVIRLSPEQTGAKLARARRQHALLVDPDSIVSSDRELLAQMKADIDKDWKLL